MHFKNEVVGKSEERIPIERKKEKAVLITEMRRKTG